MPINTIKNFLKLESSSGIFLLIAAGVALLISNSPWADAYEHFLEMPIGIHLGGFTFSKHVIHWVNDGFMAIFFLLVGLELKREFFEGQLSSLSQVFLSGFAAFGGMVVPALFYIVLNYQHPVGIDGWAIPVATDIAFALGILALLGSRVPTGLKLFLMALAIFDDLGAIVIIAIFHTSELSLTALGLALIMVSFLVMLNLMRVQSLRWYILGGILLWLCVLSSGVHATLAGVVLAFTIPLRAKQGSDVPPLHYLEQRLHPWVAYMIMPVFALANAGVDFSNISPSALFNPIPLGIILGLFVGKQLGVFGFTWLAVKIGLAKLPRSVSWFDIYGVGILCGIGFTMSLFIGSLAFTGASGHYLMEVRLGVLVASILSGGVGYMFLRLSLSKWWHKKSRDIIE